MATANTNVTVRPANAADAIDCSTVLCASIRKLCIPDHKGDEQTIARWLENKTPETLQSWIESAEATIYVAEIEGEIVGVGGLSGSEVALNYVSPDHRNRGVSRTMLKTLERELLNRGIRTAVLTSTATAQEFYRRNGWLDSGEPVESLGVMGYPMSKAL